jgi:hypothetical protein
VAELVDALDSKSSAERRGGSIPSWGTGNLCILLIFSSIQRFLFFRDKRGTKMEFIL